MAGLTSNAEITPKIKKLVDDVYFDLVKKWENKGKSQDLICTGFELYRNEMISRLKREKMDFSQRRK